MHKQTAEVKPEVTRGWMEWIAVVIALVGVCAGYAFVNARFDPSPTVENYAGRRAFLDWLRGAVFFVSLGAPLVSLALGLMARSRIGILAGALAAAFTVFWVPSHLRACCGGDESSVIGLLRSINSAQQAYASVCGRDKFAPTLETLGRPLEQGGAPFLSPEGSRGAWHGYAVTMQIPDGAATDVVACDGTRVVSSYFVEAHLIDAIPGRRNFATDERGAIYSNQDGAVIQPGMVGAEPVQ